jgi:hypothetical protein
MDLGEAVRARLMLARFVIENRDGGCVALHQDEVGEAGRHHLAVFQLRHAAGPIFHAFAAIEQEMRDEVRLLLVLLDVIAITSTEHLPIEVTRVVAGHVLAVLRELDREPSERGFVRAGHVALHNGPRLKPKVLRALDRLWIQQRADLVLLRGTHFASSASISFVNVSFRVGL